MDFFKGFGATLASAVLMAFLPEAGAQDLPIRPIRTLPITPLAKPGANSLPITTSPVLAVPRYVLNEGAPVHEELQRWAQAAGWKLIWYPRKSWQVIAKSAFSNDLDVAGAVEAVVNGLRSEGKQILLTVAAANRVMEITSTDITAESNDGNEE